MLAGVDAALDRYDGIDADRLGIEGRSYGGQLTNWIVTQTDRFRAAIPVAGISNLVSFNYMAYYHDYLAVEFGGFPHEDGLIDLLWERSPIRYAARVRTPVLLMHGENDNDVLIAEAEQFYIALQDVGVETVMVRYPREGHGTPGDPARDRCARAEHRVVSTPLRGAAPRPAIASEMTVVLVLLIAMGLAPAAVAATSVRVEFTSDGRCQIRGSGPSFRADLSYPRRTAELKCALPGGAPGEPVVLEVVLPAAVRPSEPPAAGR